MAQLQEQLGLDDAELKIIVERHPAVLGYSFSPAHKNLAQLQEHLGLDAAELKSLLKGEEVTILDSYAPLVKPTSGSSPFAHMFKKQNGKYTALFGSTGQE
jgi:hypothetical protein